MHCQIFNAFMNVSHLSNVWKKILEALIDLIDNNFHFMDRKERDKHFIITRIAIEFYKNSFMYTLNDYFVENTCHFNTERDLASRQFVHLFSHDEFKMTN